MGRGVQPNNDKPKMAEDAQQSGRTADGSEPTRKEPYRQVQAWQVLASGSVLLVCAIFVMVFFSQTFELGDETIHFLLEQVQFTTIPKTGARADAGTRARCAPSGALRMRARDRPFSASRRRGVVCAAQWWSSARP